MPELPEVETTMRGIAPALCHQTIDRIDVRQDKLRYPVPAQLNAICKNQKILTLSRRGKYLVMALTRGTVLIHLGMSGHLRLLSTPPPVKKHDHIDLILKNGLILRYNDPRRFGLWLYTTEDPQSHPLLKHLGHEPLSDQFNVSYLSNKARGKSQSIKAFIMNSQVVVGVGNIYATESLFLSGLHPLAPAGKLTRQQLNHLVNNIQQILQRAIDCGGTTLKDFYSIDGKPGYFAQSLQVYGRQGLLCSQCNTMINSIKIVGRSTAFCPNCQPLIE